MEIIQVKLNELKGYELNSKIHTDAQIKQIAKSILEFGYNDLIAVDENLVIIEGHGRFQALEMLGREVVEVIQLTHLTEEQKNAYRIIHNKLNMNTDFDFERLKAELETISTIAMDELGFTQKELDDLLMLEQQLEPDTEPKVKEQLICPYCGHVDDKGEFKAI